MLLHERGPQPAFDLSIPEPSNDVEPFMASLMAYEKEHSRLNMLKLLAYAAAASSNHEEDVIEKKIQSYRGMFGFHPG